MKRIFTTEGNPNYPLTTSSSGFLSYVIESIPELDPQKTYIVNFSVASHVGVSGLYLGNSGSAVAMVRLPPPALANNNFYNLTGPSEFFGIAKYNAGEQRVLVFRSQNAEVNVVIDFIEVWELELVESGPVGRPRIVGPDVVGGLG